MHDDAFNNTEDVINHPKHYCSKNGLEAIEVIEDFTADLKGIQAVCTANVIKYILRWKQKNGLEDLKKARWYLDKLIKDEELEVEIANDEAEEAKWSVSETIAKEWTNRNTKNELKF